MSFTSLNIGASALYAAQRAAEVAAHNVANANTPGYTKQRVELGAATPTPGTPGLRGDGMRGNGVSVLDINRVRDVLSDVSYRSEAGSSAAADARSSVLSRAEVVLGTYPDGATKSLDDFYSSWDALNRAPGSTAARAGVLEAGREVASALGTASAQLDQIVSDTGASMVSGVAEVNDVAKHVAALNQSIADAVTGGQSPNDLMDQRDQAIDRLATLTGSSIRTSGNGAQVDVYVGNSILVSGVTTRTLSATHTGAAWTVSFENGTPAVLGGQIGAQAKAVSVEIPAFSQQLDAIAASLAASVNAVHAASYSLNSPSMDTVPTPTPDGGAFFVGTTAKTIGVRADLTPNGVAASATGASADGNAALTMSNLRTAGNPSVLEALRGAATGIGTAAAGANRDQATAASSLSGADARRQSADGVNTDEEMVDLVKFQHSYEAAARVISTADGFFDTIINHMGAGR